MEVSDLKLIQSCISGQRDAFEEIVNRYKKLVFSVIIGFTKDQHDVNDIAQEVFIKIYKALDKYNSEYKFSTWVVKITTNHCLDTVRKQKYTTVPMDEITNIAKTSDSPESRYIRKEQKSTLKRAICELPEMYRIPIVLFHQNGLSYDEITKILDEPISIVKNRLYRARLMLKEKLLIERNEGAL